MWVTSVALVSPLLMEPKATMPTTPRMTTTVPFAKNRSDQVHAMNSKETYIDVGTCDWSSDEKAGEEEVEDERGGTEGSDVLYTSAISAFGEARQQT